MKMGSLDLKGHTQEHADAVQTKLPTVCSMRKTASEVVSDKHRTDAGETEPSDAFVVENQPANSSAGDTVPSASCTDTSCADAGIFAEVRPVTFKTQLQKIRLVGCNTSCELVNPSTQS